MIAADTSTPTASWESAADALADLRSAGDEFEKFFLGRIDELDTLRAELAGQQQKIDVDLETLSAEHVEIEREWQRLEEFHRTAQQAAHHVQNESRRLAKAQAELQAAHAELAAERTALEAAHAELARKRTEFDTVCKQNNDEAEERFRRLQADFDVLRGDQARSLERAAEVDPLKSQLAAVQVELEVTRQELARQAERLHRENDNSASAVRSQLAAAETLNDNLSRDLIETRDQVKRLTEVTVETSQLREQIAKLSGQLAEARGELLRERQRASEASDPHRSSQQRRIHELEKENAALETELEALRHRAAELAEHVTHTTRSAAEERAQWLGEMRQLRRMVERSVQARMDQFVVAAPTANSSDVEPAAADTAAPVGAADPVLDSVMAQFELLQRDLSRRRTTPSSTNAAR